MGELIAVTGATGKVGGRVARRLAAAGVEQRLVVRDPSRAPTLPGAAVAVGSYGDGDAMRKAFDGADIAFLVSAAEAADRVEQHRTAVDAAVAAGVGRIVYLSFLGAAPDATFTLARHHWATEQHVRQEGVAFTFLRDNLYIDFVPHATGLDGVIRGPAGNGAVSVVAHDDIADVAAAVLLASGDHDGATYDLTGPAALKVSEMVEELSRVAGRAVTYVDETLGEAFASRAVHRAPDWEVEGWVTSYAAIAAGELATVSGDVRRVAGHEPMSYAQFLRDHPEAWAHLT